MGHPTEAVRFPWNDAEITEQVSKAVQAYWRERGGLSRKQYESGARDAGRRGEVTGGQHLNAFVTLLCEVIHAAGFDGTEIFFKRGVELPGYYRAQKKWDIVVVREKHLCAAIEMKSQVGPSFGNNFNNRSEEALGSATDFWVAYREGVIGEQPPWLGYFLLIEDAPGSKTPVRLKNAVFEPMPIFRNTSYIDRYSILCQRMMLERNYSAAALITAPNGDDGSFSEPSAAMSFATFARSLFGHLVGIG